MDRRHFFALTGVSLASGCTGREARVAAKDSSGGRSAEGRYYTPVTQLSPLGHRVIHDRSTYLEQYKYENWEPGRDWKDEAALWMDLSYRWGQCVLPIQRRPVQVIEGLYLLGPEDYHQSIYLWDTGEGLLLIDPSYSRFQPIVETQIRQLGWELKDVKWVLLTHMHWDHAQSAAAWEKKGVPVYIHADDEGYLTGRIDSGGSEPVYPVATPVVFKGGDELKFGGLKMRAIHTPGHTAGSACFSVDWKGHPVLVSGDIVLHWGRHAWMGADYCNWDQYLASLWKLHDDRDGKKWRVMLPGHGTIDLEGATDSLYAVIQVVSEIIRRRRAGSDIDWIDPHHLFWQIKQAGGPQLEVLRS